MTRRWQFSLGSFTLIFLLTAVCAGVARASVVVGVLFALLAIVALVRTVRTSRQRRARGESAIWLTPAWLFVHSLFLVVSFILVSLCTVVVTVVAACLYVVTIGVSVCRTIGRRLRVASWPNWLSRQAVAAAVFLGALDRRLVRQICGATPAH